MQGNQGAGVIFPEIFLIHQVLSYRFEKLQNEKTSNKASLYFSCFCLQSV